MANTAKTYCHPATFAILTGAPYTLFDYGFTGHVSEANILQGEATTEYSAELIPGGKRIGEHLPYFDLINMPARRSNCCLVLYVFTFQFYEGGNGRVYDPQLGRFLSPDPYVQAPDFTQNYNRYSYVLNNPMKYTDPDGEWVHLAIGAIIGGYINLAMNADNVENIGDMFMYFGIGAAAGALGAGVGSGVSAALAGNASVGGGFAAGFTGKATLTSIGFTSGAISGASAGVTNGLVSGTVNGLASGLDFEDAFLNNGLEQAWKQGVSAAILGGISGGIYADNHDRNFWTGSPKQEVVGNSKHLSSLHDYERPITSKGTKNYNDVYVPEKKEPFTMEIEISGMKEITHIEKRFPSINRPYVNYSLNKNKAILEFPIGTQSDGYLSLRGWRWQHNSANSFWPSKLIYSKRSDYSSLFHFFNN